eukprot:716345_1
MFWKWQGMSHGLKQGGRLLIGGTCFVVAGRKIFNKTEERKRQLFVFLKIKQTRHAELTYRGAMLFDAAGYSVLGYNVIFKPTVKVSKWIKFPIGLFVISAGLAFIVGPVSRHA